MIHSYPFYIADWRGSEAVMSMTVEERGLYRELLDHCWETGSLPADETILRKIAQATEREWRRSWPKVRQQFTEHDGRLWHPKVDAKRPGLEEWHRSRREAGRVGGLKRWGKSDDGSASSLASSLVNGSATSKPVAELKPSSSSSSSSKKARAALSDLADDGEPKTLTAVLDAHDISHRNEDVEELERIGADSGGTVAQVREFLVQKIKAKEGKAADAIRSAALLSKVMKEDFPAWLERETASDPFHSGGYRDLDEHNRRISRGIA